MPLFEVAILQNPTKKEVEEGSGTEKLVFGPKPIVAKDSQAAAIVAIMDQPLDASVDKSRINVLVRPFA